MKNLPMSHDMQTIDQIIEDFSLFDDWTDRYRYLIDLGRKVPAMPEHLKTAATLVPGCTSKVWMVPGITDGRFHLIAASDSDIVQGLIYLLMAVYQGRTMDHVREFDIKNFFGEIGFEQNLMPNRRNGFYAMVERIRAFSQQA